MTYQLTSKSILRNLSHTNHSGQRAAQRGIKNDTIKTLITEGNVIYKQGLKFYYMIQSDLNYYAPSTQKSLKNLVVVMASDSNTIITCYKNKAAVKNIKRKSKRLIRY